MGLQSHPCRALAVIIVGTVLLLAEAAAHGQIVFRSIDPRRMTMVPLAKEAYPSRPFLPNPRLHTQNILPQHIQFDEITRDNLVMKNVRPNHLEVPPLVQETIVQRTIAPPKLRRGIVGPTWTTPQPKIPREVTRKDFEYQHPQFEPKRHPRPSYDGSMFLTPSLFSDRPLGWDRPNADRKTPTPAARPAPSGGNVRRPLGW